MSRLCWDWSGKIGLMSGRMPSPPSSVPTKGLTEPTVCSVCGCTCVCVHMCLYICVCMSVCAHVCGRHNVVFNVWCICSVCAPLVCVCIVCHEYDI